MQTGKASLRRGGTGTALASVDTLVDGAAAALCAPASRRWCAKATISCIVTDVPNDPSSGHRSIPGFIGTLPATVKHFVRFFRQVARAGRCAITPTTCGWEPGTCPYHGREAYLPQGQARRIQRFDRARA